MTDIWAAGEDGKGTTKRGIRRAEVAAAHARRTAALPSRRPLSLAPLLAP